MKNFTPEMTGKEKENARIVKAYEIAKKICKITSSYSEALEILSRAKRELERAMLFSEPKVRDQPRDDWGKVIELPETEVPGKE